MRRVLLLLAVVAAGLTLIQPARADYAENHVRLLCAAAENIAVVQFSVVDGMAPVEWPPVPAGLDQGVSSRPDIAGAPSCILANGVTVDFQQGEDAGIDDRACGQPGAGWVDVWVGHKKLLKRRVFSDCTGQSIHNVVVGPKQITLCVPDDDPDGDFTYHPGRQPFHCAPLALTDYPGPPDYARYPPPGATPVHDEVLRYNAVPADLCGKLLAADKAAPHDGYEPDQDQRMQVDLFNDGQRHTVYRISSRRVTMGYSDSLVVVDDPAFNAAHDDPRPKDGFVGLTENADAKFDFRFDGEDPLTGDDHSYIELLDLDGRSYVSVAAVNQAGPFSQTFYAGDPVEKLRTVCIFDRVRQFAPEMNNP